MEEEAAVECSSAILVGAATAADAGAASAALAARDRSEPERKDMASGWCGMCRGG